MKNTKKVCIVGGLILSLAFISVYSMSKSIKIEPKLSDKYMSDIDLLEKSTLVVEVEVGSAVENIVYSDVEFQLSNVKVLSVLNSPDFEVETELNILETVFYNDTYPLLNNDDRYILFLDLYVGPVTNKKCFIISGTNLGSISYEENLAILNDRQLNNFNYLTTDKYQDEAMNMKEKIIEHYSKLEEKDWSE